jgi:hypothetical protein
LAAYHCDMADPPAVRGDPLQRYYPWLLASNLVILLCVAAIGLVVPDRWNGVYLAWGLVIGAAIVLLYLGIMAYVGRRLEQAGRPISPAKREQMRQRRRFVVVPGCVTMGLAWGGLSAIFDTPVPLLLFVGIILIAFVIPWAIAIPLLLRRVRGQQA